MRRRQKDNRLDLFIDYGFDIKKAECSSKGNRIIFGFLFADKEKARCRSPPFINLFFKNSN